MPPKRLKKDAVVSKAGTSQVKEQPQLGIDELLFPKSIVASLARESLQHAFQENGKERRVTISKDSVLVLQRSGTAFVNYLLMFAREIAKKNGRKSCNDQDVLNALEHVGLGALKSIVDEKLRMYQEAVTWRKQNKVVVSDDVDKDVGEMAESKDGNDVDSADDDISLKGRDDEFENPDGDEEHESDNENIEGTSDIDEDEKDLEEGTETDANIKRQKTD